MAVEEDGVCPHGRGPAPRSRTPWATGLAIMALLGVTTLPLVAAAEGGERHTIVGLKGSYQLGLAHGEAHHLAGAGGFFEYSVVPHLLEVELSARYLTDGHISSIPVELLAKVPFHPTPALQPFVGAGVVVAFVSQDGDSETAYGGVAVAGLYYWLGPHWGLLAEVGYGLVNEHGAVHEIFGNGGVAYGW